MQIKKIKAAEEHKSKRFRCTFIYIVYRLSSAFGSRQEVKLKMYKKKTLLERYGIPIHHLDFAYINECSNAREMEKIVRILRSGEEGYYAELTACAEEKLRALYPNSRLLRVEEKLLGRYALTNNELKPIYV